MKLKLCTLFLVMIVFVLSIAIVAAQETTPAPTSMDEQYKEEYQEEPYKGEMMPPEEYKEEYSQEMTEEEYKKKMEEYQGEYPQEMSDEEYKQMMEKYEEEYGEEYQESYDEEEAKKYEEMMEKYDDDEYKEKMIEEYCGNEVTLLKQRIADLEKFIEESDLELPEPSEEELELMEKREEYSEETKDYYELKVGEPEETEENNDEENPGVVKKFFKRVFLFFGN